MSETISHIEKKTTLVPELRFKEFDGEWAKHTLKNLLESLIDCEHKTAPYVDESEYLVVRTNNVKGGQLVYHDIKYTSEEGFREWTKRSVPKYGDILFTREAPAGESCLVPKDKKVCLGQRMVLLKADESKISGQYLSIYLQSGSATRNISNLSIGTTVTRINIADIYKLKCPVSSLQEQQKIASFLTAVDEKIQQLTRKKELLEDYKKGVMQQIFSQQIRFKPALSGVEGDDNGNDFPEWQTKRLGELTKKVGKKNKDNIQYPIYSINNQEGFRPQSEQFEGLDSNDRGYDISMYKIVYPQTFAYNPARINVGSIGYSYDLNEVIISSLYVCFQTKKELEDLYLLAYLDTFRFKKDILRYEEGGVRQYLFYENFSHIKIPLPSNKEQLKIAEFLLKLDDRIKDIENKIAQTQTFKKGLLQKMFV